VTNATQRASALHAFAMSFSVPDAKQKGCAALPVSGSVWLQAKSPTSLMSALVVKAYLAPAVQVHAKACQADNSYE
jgi:hypothetical protein